MTIPKTAKLYLDDSYSTTFRASVVAVTPRSQDTFDVVLNESAFYPESGGQRPDRGMLGRCEIIDVSETDDDVVVHTIRAAQAPDGEVECVVDWDVRFDHMQQHTGQHVLSRAFIKTGDLRTVSFHMGDDSCTIDLEGTFADDSITRAEALANKIIQQNRPVRISTVSVDELEATELRGKVPDGISEARLVEIIEFDTIPCCGTHVRSTGELGLIKVTKHERVKKKIRVHFKVGLRALHDYGIKHDIVQALAGRLTTSAAEVAGAVDHMIGESQAAKKRFQRVSKRLAAIDAERIRKSATMRGDIAVVIHRDPETDVAYARLLSSAFKELPATVALVAANDGTVVCSASPDVDIDFPEVAKDLVAAAGGTGGGKGSFAQFKFPGDADIGALMEEVEENVVKHL